MKADHIVILTRCTCPFHYYVKVYKQGKYIWFFLLYNETNDHCWIKILTFYFSFFYYQDANRRLTVKACCRIQCMYCVRSVYIPGHLGAPHSIPQLVTPKNRYSDSNLYTGKYIPEHLMHYHTINMCATCIYKAILEHHSWSVYLNCQTYLNI